MLSAGIGLRCRLKRYIVHIICSLFISHLTHYIHHTYVTDKKESSPPSKERRAPRRRLTQNNSGMRGSFTTSLQNVLEDEPTTQTNDNDNSNSQDLGKSHEQFEAQLQQSLNNIDTSSQSTDDTTTNNNYRPKARRPNRHLHGKSGRMNKSLVQSLKFDSIFSSQTTRNSSSLPSDLQNYNESINIMDFGVSEDKFNASFNLSDPSNAASGVTSPSNGSNNMSYLVDSDNFMGWNGSKGNDSSLSNLVDSQGFLNWNASADSQEDVDKGAQSKEGEDTTEEQDDTITPIEDEHGGKLSKSSSTSSSTENLLTKQMKRLSSTLSTATKRSSWDTTNGSRRASEELSDIEDNESFAMPRFNKEDEHVDIGELRKDLIAAAKKESDEGGGKKNPFLKRVSCLLEQSG